MKCLPLSFLFAICSIPFGVLTGQILQPQFEMPFYFEDGAGNRDTLIIGYDDDANGSFNPQFGEVHIEEPFDSVFEVRAMHGDSWMRTLKRIIGSYSIPFGERCGVSEGMYILLRIEHFPLTVSWGPALLHADFCNEETFMVNTPIFDQVGPQFLQDHMYYCLSPDRDTFVEEWEQFYNSSYNWWLLFEGEVEGIGLDTLLGLQIVFDRYTSICPQKTTVAVDETELVQEALEVFPNPATELLILRGEFPSKALELKLFDSSGRKISPTLVRRTPTEIQLDTGGLPQGFYFGYLKSPDQPPRSFRFLKS